MSNNSSPDRFYRLTGTGNLQQPDECIEQFCSAFSLGQARIHLWEFFKSYLEDPDGLTNREERSDALFFYESTDTVLEAIYLMQEKKKQP